MLGLAGQTSGHTVTDANRKFYLQLLSQYGGKLPKQIRH